MTVHALTININSVFSLSHFWSEQLGAERLIIYVTVADKRSTAVTRAYESPFHRRGDPT
jgi:hypothetical protein